LIFSKCHQQRYGGGPSGLAGVAPETLDLSRRFWHAKAAGLCEEMYGK
jgi:hypothetical protein